MAFTSFIGGGNGFKIRTTNLEGNLPQLAVKDILSNKLTVDEVSVFMQKKTAEYAKSGNQDKSDKLGSLAAFFDVGAKAARSIPEEKRVDFIKNYIDPNGDGKFNSVDIKMLDSNGDGIIEFNEMRQYLSNSADKAGSTGPISSIYKRNNNFTNDILRNSYFNQDGSVKMDAFKE